MTTHLGFLLAFLATAAFAQSALSFEVASVKPSDPNARGVMMRFMPGGGVTIVNATLKSIIELTYDVDRLQVTGGPAWIESERFDILAKGPEPSYDEAQTRERLRTLLGERFHLVIHHESRERSVYTLTVAKNGAKMKMGRGGERYCHREGGRAFPRCNVHDGSSGSFYFYCTAGTTWPEARVRKRSRGLHRDRSGREARS
jgi:uncharacterized protein (TIGR03435 family)